VKRVYAEAALPSSNGGSDHFEGLVRDLLNLAENHAHRREIMTVLAACVPEYQPEYRPSLEKSALVV